jgi:hypothetical protein
VLEDGGRSDERTVRGTPDEVAMGANRLLLNPVCRHAEQVETLAAIVGLS